MIPVKPEKSAAYKKAPDLIPSVIKNGALPVRVKSHPGILVFEEMGSVEDAQPMGVRGEM
jgi:hypothetical protein